MVAEKRKEHRIKVSLPIKIISSGNFEIAGRTENISRLGTYIEINRHIPVGKEVDIILEIPAYTQNPSLIGEVKCKANIFRSNLIRKAAAEKHYGLGIFFTDFPRQADRDKLSRYIDYLLNEEKKAVREGLKLWREKKTPQIMTKQKDYQAESLRLLKQISNRLEEIARLLQKTA